MICPKCKTEVSSQDTICPGCGLRLKFKCPRCGNYTRIGSSSCSVCGFAFVKFCPKCGSANYASSPECRKCSYVFDNPKKEQEHKEKKRVELKNEQPQKKVEQVTKKEQTPPPQQKLVVFIDFINLETIFNKYKDEEFRQKVVLNIKTSIKLGFNVSCEFINPHTVVFKIPHTKNFKFLDKVKLFSDEFEKFNNILNETLGAGITYKYAVLKEDEYKEALSPKQLESGIEKDIITSEGAYELLSSEIPLIKISPVSYKMVFLDQKPVFSQSECQREDVALEMVLDAINDSNSEIKAISINAPRGCGKTYLLDSLYKRLDGAQHILLKGHCCALTQVTPLGLIQDICLSLFDLSFAPSRYEKRVQELKNALGENLSGHVPQEKIDTLINIAYPLKEAYYEYILENKKKTFEDLKDILVYLKSKNQLTLVIDDFDLIDETSFDFIKYLIECDYFKSGAKMLLTYRNQHAIAMYINSEKLPKNACLNINLARKEANDVREFIKSQIGDCNIIPQGVLNQITLNAQGNFAYVEQVLYSLIETKILALQNKTFAFDPSQSEMYITNSLKELLDERFTFLKENHRFEYEFLMISSMLGGKFTKSLMEKVFALELANFEKVAAFLEKNGYVKRITENIFEFKNSLVWSYVYACAKDDKDILEAQKKLLNEICKRTVSSPAIPALLAQVTGEKDLAFSLWTMSLKLASYIGDVSFYTLCQKQSLILLEDVKLANFEYIKNNICERLGKLTYNKNPKEAMEYLSNAIVSAQKSQNENKVVELSGYLIQSCKIAQNYPAIVETVDAVLAIYSKPKQELQRALIKTRKLEALLHLGNWSEIASIVNNEVNPVLQDFLRHPKKNEFASIREVYEAWIMANIVLAESFAQQGSPLAFELIEEIQKELNKDKSHHSTRLKLHLALAHACAQTSRGFVKDSDEILQSILKEFSYAVNDLKLVSKWNLIDVFNKIFGGNFENIKEDLFEAVTFANNCGDDYTKNILKTMLAYILLKENNALRALEICAEQMTYFSDKKIAFGALLAWYISAKATLPTSGADRCIEICEKAVTICESAKISSINFKILFQELLSRAYLQKNDFDNAKMYCELALQDASANELLFLQMRLYRLRANIMQDSIAHVEDEKKLALAQNTVRIYEKALYLAGRLALEKHQYTIQKELTAFRAYCQLKRIS